MPDNKKTHKAIKTRLHPHNKHNTRYDFKELIISYPALSPFVKLNKYNDESIDFSDADAVKALNSALLKQFYSINTWEIPNGYLCPPIPGRADYIHHLADAMANLNKGHIPQGANIKCLDIGVGANCIYPIIGTAEYGWSFIGSDIDPVSIAAAHNIVKNNERLTQRVSIRLQEHKKDFFYGVISKEEKVDFTLCNPPFHASAKDAANSTQRKLNNLTHKKNSPVVKNFGGVNNELWYEGGERKFVLDMVRESKKFSKTVCMFSSLLSKQSNVKAVQMALKEADARNIKTIPMGQGNKSSRIITWSFLSAVEQKNWMEDRWK
ncbi:23S rRNA (adenine(1618)-N(6))-methyltransferase [hydrothermal vent metagenome]|uniref:23S rRNA (Adenine(1618)-N(6))-methyltransferase n=1 Tax=hydrothermal vent metagenome TaxID=652676 RepID=A0A3B0U5W9_9ZZZZ